MNAGREHAPDLESAQIAYGFWRYGPEDADAALRAVEAARDVGINHLDTADVYGYPDFGAAEQLLGNIRKQAPSLMSGVEIATKAGVEIGTPYNASAAYLSAAIDASLQRLGVDCVDLFYVHRPDILTHPAETAGALDQIVTSGKARAIGVSNYSVSQTDALAAHLRTPIKAIQIEFSALHASPAYDGVLDQALAAERGVYAWSPLAGGRLFDDSDAVAKRVRRALAPIAESRDWPLSTAALAFVLSHPSRPRAIVGTRTPDRLQAAMQATSSKLTRKEWYDVYQASSDVRLP